LKYSLVNYTVSQEELIPLATKIAGKIIRNSPQAINAAIQAINANYDNDKNGFNTEIELFGACFETDDFKEGTTAFLEKRKANFNQ